MPMLPSSSEQLRTRDMSTTSALQHCHTHTHTHTHRSTRFLSTLAGSLLLATESTERHCHSHRRLCVCTSRTRPQSPLCPQPESCTLRHARRVCTLPPRPPCSATPHAAQTSRVVPMTLPCWIDLRCPPARTCSATAHAAPSAQPSVLATAHFSGWTDQIRART
jgi:hypothetical protein